jgi:hypothetical protein
MFEYVVKYKQHRNGDEKTATIQACSKYDAYFKACFCGGIGVDNIWALWVDAVNYKNGSRRVFNTFEGKPI